MAVVCASLAPVAGVVAPAHAEPSKPMLLGMATADWRNVLPAFAQRTGGFPSFRQVFWNLDRPWSDVDYGYVFDGLSDFGMGLYAEIQVDDMPALVGGGSDAALDRLVANVSDAMSRYPDVRLLLAPLPEMNLSDWPWGGNPEAFRAGYLRIHRAVRAGGLGPDRVRFVFAVNGPGQSYRPYYPGDEVVDIVGFSRLNRNDPWLDYHESFGRFIDRMREEVTVHKPILATQTGSVTETGNRDVWLREMFRKLSAHDQVIGAVYFNRDKYEAGKANDYRIATPSWVDPVIGAEYGSWSPAGAIDWVFDGRMDAWVEARKQAMPFVDVAGSSFQEEIAWLAAEGISQGCAPHRFCPGDRVTRAQMASFLVRALPITFGGVDFFRDDDGSVHEPSINGLAADGVTKGCGDLRFCPGDPVTRAQMASFLVRALQLDPSPVDYFEDDAGSVHEANINSLARSGITLGCAAGLYCPTDLVTREQMAAFLYRALSSR